MPEERKSFFTLGKSKEIEARKIYIQNFMNVLLLDASICKQPNKLIEYLGLNKEFFMRNLTDDQKLIKQLQSQNEKNIEFFLQQQNKFRLIDQVQQKEQKTIEVFFSPNQSQSIQINNYTRVSNVIQMIAEQKQLGCYLDFRLFISYKNQQSKVLLDMDEVIVHLVNQWDITFFFQKYIFLPHQYEIVNDGRRFICAQQFIQDVYELKYLLSEQKYFLFIALFLYSKLGVYKSQFTKNYLSALIREIVPYCMYKQRDEKIWIQNSIDKWKKMELLIDSIQQKNKEMEKRLKNQLEKKKLNQDFFGIINQSMSQMKTINSIRFSQYPTKNDKLEEKKKNYSIKIKQKQQEEPKSQDMLEFEQEIKNIQNKRDSLIQSLQVEFDGFPNKIENVESITIPQNDQVLQDIDNNQKQSYLFQKSVIINQKSEEDSNDVNISGVQAIESKIIQEKPPEQGKVKQLQKYFDQFFLQKNQILQKEVAIADNKLFSLLGLHRQITIEIDLDKQKIAYQLMVRLSRKVKFYGYTMFLVQLNQKKSQYNLQSHKNMSDFLWLSISFDDIKLLSMHQKNQEFLILYDEIQEIHQNFTNIVLELKPYQNDKQRILRLETKFSWQIADLIHTYQHIKKQMQE